MFDFLEREGAQVIVEPIAANMGTAAILKLDRCPPMISFFISNPIRKKKIAIRPSLIQFSKEYFRCMAADSKPNEEDSKF